MKKFIKKYEVLYKYLKLTAASALYALSLSLFLDPNNLAPGGVSGISILLNRVVDIPTGTLYLLINIPILILGMWKFGFRFIISTLYNTALITLCTNYLASFEAVTADPLLAVLVGGSLQAVALGIVFKAGSTTGGTDIIVKVLRARYPHIKTGAFVLLTDVIVVVISAFVFKAIDTALYAGLAVALISFVLDLVLYGRDGAKLLFIISDRSEEITERMLKELDVGCTFIEGYGAYSKKNKKVIMCVMHKNLFPKAEEIIKAEDSEAFIIVSSASEIYGEGYKNIFAEKI